MQQGLIQLVNDLQLEELNNWKKKEKKGKPYYAVAYS